MGIMQSFRQKMPVVVIVLIVTFVVLMVLGDILSPGGGSLLGGAGSATAAGEVNGEEINARAYYDRVNSIIENQRAQNPDAPVDEEQIREGVWQAMVDELLIQQTANDLGIFVSDQELAELLLYDPPQVLKQQFTDSNGVFLQAQYFEFMRDIDGTLSKNQVPANEIARIKASVKSFEEDLRRQLLRQSVENVVTASAMPSPAEARSAFDDQRAKASGSYVMIDAAQIPDSAVTVSDDEARKYYDSHKTAFQQTASRQMRYAMFALAPSSQDSSTVNRRLQTATSSLQKATTPQQKDSIFQSLADQFGAGKYTGAAYTPMQDLSPELQSALQGATPGSVIGPVRLSDGTYLINVADVKDSGEVFVTAQHILLRTTGTGDDSVKAEADKLLQQVKAGESFDALAQKYSADPGSGQRGGDLGYFRRGMMVKPFEDAAFAAANGSIVGPIKTDFGYHIIKVNDRSSRSYKLRDLRFDPKISNITKNSVRARVQKFREALVNGTQIDTLAAQQKVQVMETGPLNRMQPAGGSMALTNFAYAGKVGDVSEVVELPDGSMMVGQISKVNNAGLMDFADAKESIVARLRTGKKLDQLKAKAETLRRGLAAGDSLSKLTAIDPSVQVRSFSELSRSSPFPGVGFDYPLTNAVFSTPLNQISQPIRGERGYYILTVSTRTQPNDQEYEAERVKFVQQLTTQRRQALFQEWLTKMRERSVIEDHRSRNQM